jgi:hypothetical protein
MNLIKKRTVMAIFIILLSTQTILLTTQSAPTPPTETYTLYVYSDESVYVMQSSASTNFNTGSYQYNLYIGQDEFNYSYISFVKFNDIDLPDDADIQSAKIRLWCPDFGAHPNAYTKMYVVTSSWNEDTLTWSNKPGTSTLLDAKNVGSHGAYDWDAFDIIDDWVNNPSSNYGVAFINEQYAPLFTYPFYSDEVEYYGPYIQITYETASGEEPDPPEEPPTDNIPCEISYTIEPENPQSGDEVTISVTATDDIAMQYISIFKGGMEVETCTAVGDETSLECSYSETFSTPGNHTFNIFADDKGPEPTQGETLYIDVAGTGSNPIVTLDIAFDGADIVPLKYQLLPMDGQEVDITATATDPDGIDMMIITYDGTPYDIFYDPPQTSVEETITLINGADMLDDCSVPCTFRYSVRAYDTEDRSTRVEGEDIDINAPWQWYWGLPFANWGCDDTHWWSWSLMESIYGDEVWWNEERGWKKPHAEYLYNHKIKEGGRGGHCYGMCTMALEFAQLSPRIYPNLVQSTAATIDDLEREDWNNTWRYYYARQAGQYSQDLCWLKAGQYLLQPERSGSGLHPFIDDILDEIIDDLNAGTPGILGIREGSKGHAVIPWRVEPLGGNRYNVYIYDPNHEYVSTHDSTDYTNFEQYPFIVFGEDGWSRDGWWSYEWNSTSTWNGNIYYYPYELVLGNPSSINYIWSSASGSTGITDQRLPDAIQALCLGSGDATFYAEDSLGRKTGHVNGVLVSNIPYSAPVFDDAGDNELVDMFMLPCNTSLTFHIESTVDSEEEIGSYSLMVWSNLSGYFLENVSCVEHTEDELSFIPRSSKGNNPAHSLKFRRGNLELRGSDPLLQGDLPDYSITLVKEFYNSPKLVGREYIFTSGQHEEGAEVELYVSDDYDELVVETFDTPFSYSVVTKSTESLDENPNIDYIPLSKGNFSMDANSKMTVSPENWSTTAALGSMTTSDEQQEGNNTSDDTAQTPGFELCLLLIATLIGLFWRKKRKNEF